jgi:endonuclease VIII
VPEGDTIYRAARALQRALAGRVITGFETGLAGLARVNDDAPLVGRVVEWVESRGKWCLMYFSGAGDQEALILVTHMLMSGSWHLYQTGERWRMGRSSMRVVVRTDEWEAVAFNVPIAEFHTARSLERSSQVPKLGPDVLASEFTVEGGVTRLETYARDHPEAEVAVVLLNQRVLAGLGNVYKSEVAFAAGVNPFRTMRTLTRGEMERMVDFALKYMRANVADGKGDGIVTYAGNRRTTHSMAKEERLWVYGRQGQECRRCGATVMMRKQGEQARSTYWCPECQGWVGDGAAPVGNVFRGAGRRKASC